MQGQSPSYVITSLVTAPASASLTTLENVRDELDLADNQTDDDGTLTRYINEESAHIARYCNRVFGFATWSDQFRLQRGVLGEGVRAQTAPLILTRYPLIAPNVIPFTGNTHSSTLVDGIASTATLSKGQLVVGAGIPPGATIASVIGANSLYLSVAATATATGVTLSTGLGVLETVAGTATWLVPGTDFEVDQGPTLPGDEGRANLWRLNMNQEPRTWPAALINVWYQAGYNLPDDAADAVPMPSDLESACILAVVHRFRARGRDPLLQERTQGGAGTERYWVGGAPGQRGSFAPDIEAMIERYRVPVIG